MNLAPTPITAGLAGLVAGAAMPAVWSRVADDSIFLIVAFLLLVALPAHAFVVGFARLQTTKPGAVDTELLKRVGAWLLCALVAAAASRALLA